jgi:hypothetical protein
MREQSSELVQIELPDGQVVLAEVETYDGDVGFSDRFKLDQVGAAAAKVGMWAHDSALKAIPKRPDRIGVQIGMKLAVKGGALTSVIANMSGEGSVVVTMEWDLDRED